MALRSLYIASISLFITFAVTSCSDKSNNLDSVTSIAANHAVNVKVDSLLQTLDVIPLELNADHYPYGVKNMIATDSIFIIFDNKNLVYIYGKDGKYISDSANKIGRGAGEYSIVTAMSYNKYNNCIEIATPSNLLFYDKEFNLVKTCNLPTKKSKDGLDGLFFGFIHDISDHEHLLIPESILDDNRKIIHYDSDSDNVIKIVEYKQDVIVDISMQFNCFHEISENKFAFTPPGITNYIYSFNPDNGSIDKMYHINYGPNCITKSNIENISTDNERLKFDILNSDKTLPLKTMFCGNRLVIIFKDGNSLRNFHTIVWDLKNNNGYKIDTYNNNRFSFPVIDYSDNNFLYTVVDSENLPQLMQEISPSKIEIFDNSIPEGSLVLLCYRLKNDI